MKIQAVKGTRDLYPEVLAPLRRIFDTWRRVALRHGFQEYEGPTLEMLDLYREKSGDELVGQLYRLTDSAGRELALRPEMTPSLARMVAARIHALAKPIKWFCISTLFRGENVQRGRLREFVQWNVDVIGSAEMSADAECILVGVEALRELGLGAQDFAVHISNRRLISAILADLGIDDAEHGFAFSLIDKYEKLPRDAFERQWNDRFGDRASFERLGRLLDAVALDDLEGAWRDVAGAPSARRADAWIETQALMSILQNFGILDYCKIDLRGVRGLAYYTGPVFEFYDRSGRERAVCGGGRYDDLLSKLGRTQEPAVGFGMGDVVLALMLQEKGLLTPTEGGACVFVADADERQRALLHHVVAELRRKGVWAEFTYAPQGLARQLKAADKQGARLAVIVGAETADRGVVQVKPMMGGACREVPLDELLGDPLRVLGLAP